MRISYYFVVRKSIDQLLDDAIESLITKSNEKDKAKAKYLKRMRNTKKIRRK